MSGEKPLGVTGGAPGPAGIPGPTGPTSATPYRLDLTGAIVAAAGVGVQSRRWATADMGALDRIVAVRSGVFQALDFLVPDPSKTVWLEVYNDNGDLVFTRAIDAAHYTPDTSTGGSGALPLIVGPYDWQGANPYYFAIRTDAASLALLDPAVGIIFGEVEIVTMAATVAVSTTPIPVIP